MKNAEYYPNFSVNIKYWKKFLTDLKKQYFYIFFILMYKVHFNNFTQSVSASSPVPPNSTNLIHLTGNWSWNSDQFFIRCRCQILIKSMQKNPYNALPIQLTQSWLSLHSVTGKVSWSTRMECGKNNWWQIWEYKYLTDLISSFRFEMRSS